MKKEEDSATATSNEDEEIYLFAVTGIHPETRDRWTCETSSRTRADEAFLSMIKDLTDVRVTEPKD